jgi:hypothetical protein
LTFVAFLIGSLSDVNPGLRFTRLILTRAGYRASMISQNMLADHIRIKVMAVLDFSITKNNTVFLPLGRVFSPMVAEAIERQAREEIDYEQKVTSNCWKRTRYASSSPRGM